MEVDSWITITVLVNLIALIFQTGAYAAPMWIWYQSSSEYFGQGLWYSVCGISTNSGNCPTTTPDEAPWLALKVLQSVGLAGVLMLTVFLIVYKLGYSSKWANMATVNLVALILCILTVLILLASAVMYCAYFWENFEYVENNDKTSLPWSWMMSLLACLILMLVCYFIRNQCRPDDPHALPMSGDDKLDFHPQVINGHVHKYYNQTPYIDEKERYVNERSRGPIRGYDDYDDRKNGGPTTYEQRTTYVNRAYHVEPEPTSLYTTKTLSREIRDNRDRELGHTIYTGNGFSYLKEEVNRPERDDRYVRGDRDDRYGRSERDDRYDRSRFDRDDRFGRQGTHIEYITTRTHQANDDFYDHLRSSVRPYPGSGRGAQPSSSVYVYRPHQY